MPTLTDLFKAQKADKYTQDGRETLDKVYHTGEISQATGLQKQPDGSWAPPKNRGLKGAGIPKANNQTFVGKTYKDFAESARASGYKPSKDTENPDGSSTTIFKNQNGEQIRVEFGTDGKITETTKESAGTEKDGFKAHHEAIESVENGNLDEQIVNTAGDIEEMRDIARDVLDATDYDDPEEFAKDVESITSSMERRYQRLERRATAPAPQRKAQSSSSLKGYLENNYDASKQYKDIGSMTDHLAKQTGAEPVDIVEHDDGTGVVIMNGPEGDVTYSYKNLGDSEGKDGPFILEKKTEDSAPSQLTGDTKIKVKK